MINDEAVPEPRRGTHSPSQRYLSTRGEDYDVR